MKLTEENKDILNEWVNEYDIEKDELIEKLKEKLDEISEGLDKEKRQNLAVQRLYMDLERGNGSGTSSDLKQVKLNGVLVGDSGLSDIIQLMKYKAKGIYKTDKTRAMADNYTNANGEPLDYRDGSDTEGELLKNLEPEWIRTLHFANVSKSGENSTKYKVMTARGDVAKNMVVPDIFTEVKFDALVGDRDDILANEDTEFIVKDDDVDFDDVEKSLSDFMIDLKDIKDYTVTHSNERNRLVVTEGIVDNVYVGDGFKTISINSVGLDDKICGEYPGISCNFPDHLELDFAESSWIKVLGIPYLKDGVPNIRLRGYYADEEEVIEPDVSDDIVDF